MRQKIIILYFFLMFLVLICVYSKLNILDVNNINNIPISTDFVIENTNDLMLRNSASNQIKPSFPLKEKQNDVPLNAETTTQGNDFVENTNANSKRYAQNQSFDIDKSNNHQSSSNMHDVDNFNDIKNNTETKPTEKPSEKPQNNFVASGCAISLEKSILAPAECDFLDYYDEAKILYDVIVNNTSAFPDIMLEIDSENDPYTEANLFIDMFNSKVLLGKNYVKCNGKKVIDNHIQLRCSVKGIYDNISKQDTIYNANISAGLYNGMSEKDAVFTIIKYICKEISYTAGYRDIYTSLNTGLGNCDSYARLFKAMCENANITCEYITGTTKGAHAWNRVLIGSEWYYSDSCWVDAGYSDYKISKSLWGTHSL